MRAGAIDPPLFFGLSRAWGRWNKVAFLWEGLDEGEIRSEATEEV